MLTITSCSRKTRSIWLGDMQIKTFSEGIPAVVSNKSSASDSILMGGTYFKRGVGAQSISVLAFQLNGKARQFSATVGADDKGNQDIPVKFFVLGDRKILFASKELKAGDAPENVNINLKGVERLGLLITDDAEGHNRTYANWADAKLEMYENYVPQNIPNDGEKYILTPEPALIPKINSAAVFGARPNNPFQFTVVATGQSPITFEAENLPAGLSIDSKSGIIKGKVSERGSYTTTLIAKNNLGISKKELQIKIGDSIALTPPIGWNGWNSWAREIDQEKVLASANAMVKSGLSNHGWTYINIDDAWQGQRSSKLNALQPNDKFPKFKEMIDEIHAKGLKVGVYSTPWITSYAGYAGGSSNFENGAFPDLVKQNKRAFRYIGKYRFEKEDAQQMASWGIDYLKYDWRIELASAERMSEALKSSGRDIVYSISNSAPFAQVKDWAKVANVYRTGPDIRDSWTSLYISAFTLDKWSEYTGPGHWGDPDMLIVGNVTTGSPMHASRLTPDEQYSHVSIFSLLSAPLMIGCPIDQIDAFTMNLLTNDEVIAINQDPLGKAAKLVANENGVQIWLKILQDGSYAVGLFYTDDFGKTPQSYFRWGNEKAIPFTFDFTKIGLIGKYHLHDVWRQKYLGEFNGAYKTEIQHHGVVLLRLFSKE